MRSDPDLAPPPQPGMRGMEAQLMIAPGMPGMGGMAVPVAPRRPPLRAANQPRARTRLTSPRRTRAIKRRAAIRRRPTSPSRSRRRAKKINPKLANSTNRNRRRGKMPLAAVGSLSPCSHNMWRPVFNRPEESRQVENLPPHSDYLFRSVGVFHRRFQPFQPLLPFLEVFLR